MALLKLPESNLEMRNMTGARADVGTVGSSEADTTTKTATGRFVLCAVN